MLHYLYQHGFRAPLTYETYKLINGADLISFLEKHYYLLNWQELRERFPWLEKRLPMLQHLSPWSMEKIPSKWITAKRLVPTPFEGWPQQRRKQLRAEGKGAATIFRQTFYPSRWWLGMYYGAISLVERLFCLLWTHPRHVYWWAWLYRSLK
jgi:hypothetical protein